MGTQNFIYYFQLYNLQNKRNNRNKMYKKKLQNELKTLKKKPVDGFHVSVDEKNILNWEILIFGPIDTHYEGGIFKAKLIFSTEYPFQPPELIFKSEFWHPNVYKNGKVCISILHTPSKLNPEEAGHCWSPVQRVETVLLSVISMLSDPNLSSPANVDASVEMRQNPEAFEMKVLSCVETSKLLASKEQLELSEKYRKKMRKLAGLDVDEDDNDKDNDDNNKKSSSASSSSVDKKTETSGGQSKSRRKKTK